jgi:hypothetical protein
MSSYGAGPEPSVLRRIPLPRTRVNKGKRKGKGQSPVGLDPPPTHYAPSTAGLPLSEDFRIQTFEEALWDGLEESTFLPNNVL